MCLHVGKLDSSPRPHSAPVWSNASSAILIDLSLSLFSGIFSLLSPLTVFSFSAEIKNNNQHESRTNVPTTEEGEKNWKCIESDTERPTKRQNCLLNLSLENPCSTVELHYI